MHKVLRYICVFTNIYRHLPIQYVDMNHEALVQNVRNTWSFSAPTLDSETYMKLRPFQIQS